MALCLPLGRLALRRLPLRRLPLRCRALVLVALLSRVIGALRVRVCTLLYGVAYLLLVVRTPLRRAVLLARVTMSVSVCGLVRTMIGWRVRVVCEVLHVLGRLHRTGAGSAKRTPLRILRGARVLLNLRVEPRLRSRRVASMCLRARKAYGVDRRHESRGSGHDADTLYLALIERDDMLNVAVIPGSERYATDRVRRAKVSVVPLNRRVSDSRVVVVDDRPIDDRRV